MSAMPILHFPVPDTSKYHAPCVSKVPSKVTRSGVLSFCISTCTASPCILSRSLMCLIRPWSAFGAPSSPSASSRTREQACATQSCTDRRSGLGKSSDGPRFRRASKPNSLRINGVRYSPSWRRTLPKLVLHSSPLMRKRNLASVSGPSRVTVAMHVSTVPTCHGLLPCHGFVSSDPSQLSRARRNSFSGSDVKRRHQAQTCFSSRCSPSRSHAELAQPTRAALTDTTSRTSTS
mmetsp:Transcript_12241/g.26656  ORF Transcript_12241/g.26656 Transcript_12241/m.26656 type:complete len:234 (-) Transcript_12241:87-788(-)